MGNDEEQSAKLEWPINPYEARSSTKFHHPFKLSAMQMDLRYKWNL
jgi:hypothetical protein